MVSITTIENYFNSNGYPNEDIEILPGMYVLCENAEFFVNQTLKCLKYHKGNSGYMPYYNHLRNYYLKSREL